MSYFIRHAIAHIKSTGCLFPIAVLTALLTVGFIGTVFTENLDIIDTGDNVENTAKHYQTTFTDLTAAFYKTGIREKYFDLTGPFEILTTERFLFFTQCGNVFDVKLNTDSNTTENALVGHIKNVSCVENFKLGMVKDTLLFDDFLLLTYIENTGEAFLLALDKIPRQGDSFDFQNPVRLFVSSPAINKTVIQHNHTFGRITRKNETEIYLVIGDYGDPETALMDNSSLGNMYQIDIHNGTATLVASGFRSPGGLYYDQGNNSLWESDHGPDGGDEINLVNEGHHYGWPHVSYGIQFDNLEQYEIIGTKWNYHDGYTKPAFIFMPNDGVSQLVQYPLSGDIDNWRGDLILATLRGKKLYRLKVENQRIIYSELLGIFGRIRDMQIDHDGTIYLKTDNRKLIIIHPGHD